MQFSMEAEFPVNPKEDREMVLASLMEDIAKAGYIVDDVLDNGKSDPVFVISGEIPEESVKTKFKHLKRKDNLVVTLTAAMDARWLRQFKILEIKITT